MNRERAYCRLCQCTNKKPCRAGCRMKSATLCNRCALSLTGILRELKIVLACSTDKSIEMSFIKSKACRRSLAYIAADALAWLSIETDQEQSA